MNALVIATVLAAAGPTVELTAEAPRAPDTQVFLFSLPQAGLLGVDGQVGLLPRFSVELGGWNVFASTPLSQAFLRGGYLGGRYTLLHTDAVNIAVGARALGAQGEAGSNVVGGVTGVADARIKVFSFLSLHPDFDLTWVGGLVSSRVTNELAFSLGDWRLGASAGVQVWAKDTVVQAAPAVALAVGWRHDLGPVALDLGGVIGLTRDPSFLTHLQVLQRPQDELSLWGGVRVGLVFTALRNAAAAK